MSNYLASIAARIKEAVSEEALPGHWDEDRLFLIYAVLALAKGVAVSGEDVHDAWVAWMIGVDDDHGALMPFVDLDREDRQQDEPFVDAIRSVARELAEVDDPGQSS